MDLTKLNITQLQQLTRDINTEKQRRKRLEPGFYKTNLDKSPRDAKWYFASLSKTYEHYKRIYKPLQNRSWDLFGVTGWSFEQFKDFLIPHLGEVQLNKTTIFSFGSWMDALLKAREEEWRKTNDSSYGKNGFCKQCDRYYTGGKCNENH